MMEASKVCKVNKSDSMRDILNYALENTKLYLKDICPVLDEYLKHQK